MSRPRQSDVSMRYAPAREGIVPSPPPGKTHLLYADCRWVAGRSVRYLAQGDLVLEVVSMDRDGLFVLEGRSLRFVSIEGAMRWAEFLHSALVDASPAPPDGRLSLSPAVDGAVSVVAPNRPASAGTPGHFCAVTSTLREVLGYLKTGQEQSIGARLCLVVYFDAETVTRWRCELEAAEQGGDRGR